MNRKFKFSIGEYYHLYSRGTDKRNIFLDDGDLRRFQVLLFLSNSAERLHLSNMTSYRGRTLMNVFSDNVSSNDLVDIGAYCLMPNHFHLLVREKIKNGISQFMKKLLTGYSMYFNKKYERTGSLFESKFKARHVNKDNYLKYLFAYIHLNPIKIIEPSWKETGIKNKSEAIRFLKSYKFSSYLDYQENNRESGKILSKKVFPAYFQKRSDFRNYIDWWLSFNFNHIKVRP